MRSAPVAGARTGRPSGAGGTRPSGERSGGRRGLARVPRGRARRSFPATLSAGSTCGSCPRSAAPRPPFPFLFPPAVLLASRGLRLARTAPRPRAPGAAARAGGRCGEGLVAGAPATAPAGAPTPRPLLLGKPAGAAGGRGRAAQTTASPRRWAVGDSPDRNGPGRGEAGRRGRTCRTGSGRPPSRPCGPPGACWSPGPGSSGAAWRLGAEGSVGGVRVGGGRSRVRRGWALPSADSRAPDAGTAPLPSAPPWVSFLVPPGRPAAAGGPRRPSHGPLA
ncbi:transgelin-2 isoform X1 [Meles meles]|uniref:transgelin-2 isoform X1 n=1 Tax=Meles meles TaxID=9662 RepID=UPI001E69A681|nr:transgelin-2 isoform X1 [Meles meles]